MSPQSAASKKRKRKRTSDSRSESGVTTSPTSPGASQGATTPDRRGSVTETITPTKDDDTVSPPTPVMASTPQRSRSSKKCVTGSMNRKRLSDLFKPEKENTPVAPSKSTDAVSLQGR